MGEELHPQALVLIGGEVAPVAADLDMQSAGAEKLYLWELHKKKKQQKLENVSMLFLEWTGPEKRQAHRLTLSGPSKAQQKFHACGDA